MIALVAFPHQINEFLSAAQRNIKRQCSGAKEESYGQIVNILLDTTQNQ